MTIYYLTTSVWNKRGETRDGDPRALLNDAAYNKMTQHTVDDNTSISARDKVRVVVRHFGVRLRIYFATTAAAVCVLTYHFLVLFDHVGPFPSAHVLSVRKAHDTAKAQFRQ